jgi:hypothetical protein
MTRFFLATVNVKLDANVIVTVLLSVSPMPGRGRVYHLCLGGEEYITYAWEGKNLGLNNSYINLFKNWKYIP